MADAKVSKESSQGRGGPQQSGIERRGEHVPSLFSMSPREFFSGSPFQMMRRLSEEMDRMFAGHTWGAGEHGLWAPAVEVRQQGDHMIVSAELPGLTKDDVHLEMTDDGLAISGERKQEERHEEEGYFRSERSYGRFYRLVPVPEGASIDQAKATFNNGVLEVSIPVPHAEPKRREIPIEAAQGGAQTRASGSGSGS